MLVAAKFWSQIVEFVENEIMKGDSVMSHTGNKENQCKHAYAFSGGLRTDSRTSAFFSCKLPDLSSPHVSFTFAPSGVPVNDHS